MGSMNLVLPEVGITPGPTWGTLLNDALVPKIEEHDHSPGSGVYVKTSGSIGIDVNGDMSFKKIGAATYSSATDLKSCEFIGAAVYPVAGNLNLYCDATDLFFRNGGGTEIQLTSGGGVPSGSQYGLTDDYDTAPLGSGKLGFISGGNLYRFTTGNAGTASSSDLAPINTRTILETDSGNLVIDAPLTVDIGSAGGGITLDSGFDMELTAFTGMTLTCGAGDDILLVGGTGSDGCVISGGSSTATVKRNITLTAGTSLIGSGRNFTFTADNGNATLASTLGDIVLLPSSPLGANSCTTTPNTVLITDNEIDPGLLETVDVGHRNRQNCISARATFDVVALTSVTPRANRWNVASGAYVTAGNYTVTLNEDIPSDASISVTSTMWGGPCFAVIASSGPTVIDVHFDAEVTAFSLIVVGA